MRRAWRSVSTQRRASYTTAASPRSRANIDHLVIAPSGVWVIDTKSGYKGKVTLKNPLFGEPKLIIAGRDKTKLVTGVQKQVELVGTAVQDLMPGTPVHGCLCFVDADLPLLGNLSLHSVVLHHPRRLAKRINAKGGLTADQVSVAAQALAKRFPPA